MKEVIRIGAKNLALLTLDEQCRRCFWIAIHSSFKGVWEKFGPIYNQLDRFLKDHVNSIIEETGRAPAWLPRAEHIVRCISIKRLEYLFVGTNVEVRGMPDAVFEMDDGTIMIVDFKTGKPKTRDHPWFAWYAAQLNAYAHMGQALYGWKISGLYMVNAVIINDKEAAADVEARREDGFVIGFKFFNVAVPIDYASTPDLTVVLRQLYDKTEPPAGREGCKDCARIKELYELMTQAQASLREDDGPVMPSIGDCPLKWQIRTLSVAPHPSSPRSFIWHP